MRSSRNTFMYAPCRCGSGRKYKFCCSRKDRESKGAAPFILDDLVTCDLEAGERLNNEGMAMLGRHQLEAAARAFRESIKAAPVMPSPHNNLALTTFVMGDIDEAIRLQEKILRESPLDNHFGEANIVHFYLAAGREKEAERKADAIERVDAHEQSTLGKQCEALARFGRHRAILDKVRRYQGVADGTLHYFAGMAAANLGDYATALDHLLRVSRREPSYQSAARFAKRIQSGQGPGTIEDNWPYFDVSNILPREVFIRMVREAEGNSDDGGELMQRRVLVEMLIVWLDEFDLKSQETLELLGRSRHPRAIKAIEKIAEGMLGSDEIRLTAMRMLYEQGVWDERKPHKIWLKGKWVAAEYRGTKIDPERATAEIDPESEPLYLEALEATRDEQFERAEILWRRLLARIPDFHPGYHNLAVVLIHLERPDEAETCLRKALAIDPNYIFGPCTLSTLYLRQDRVDEAHDVLADVPMPQEAHPGAMAAFCSAKIQLAIAEGNIDQIRPWLEMGLAADPENAGLKTLKQRLALPLAMDKMIEEFSERSRRRQDKLRQRVLSPDMPLEKIYTDYTKAQLLGIARMLSLSVDTATRKANLLKTVACALRDAGVVQRALTNLNPEERAALDAVVKAGGVMDYAAFTRTYDTDADDIADWNRQTPESLLGRLKCRGLLVEGIADRHPAVFIPAVIMSHIS